jgi:hypothetical protein
MMGMTMNKYFKKLLLGASTVVAAGSFATSVMAGPLITNWDFTLNSAFTAFAPDPGVTGSADNVLLGDPTKLSWGEPFGQPNQSSLSVSSESFGLIEGSVVTNSGVPVPTVVLTHDNNVVLLASPLLSTATITAVLNLEPTSPPGGAFDLPALEFDINFRETANLASAGACQSNFGVPGATLCEDIFVLDLPAGVVFGPDGSITQSFALDGNIYDVKIFITGLGFLSDLSCSAAGSTNGCIGLITNENAFNEVQVLLAINARTIPEPGILGLMGLALAGLVVLRRRRIV